MSKKIKQPKSREIGKSKISVEKKKTLIDPRYKNTFWTTILIIVLTIFFIINNTREEPKSGSYPPGYNPDSAMKQLNKF